MLILNNTARKNVRRIKNGVVKIKWVEYKKKKCVT